MGRFTGLMWPHYNGVGPHGYSVWSKGALGDAMNLKGPCYDQGGAHWMTKEASYYSRGHGASWHPSASMHLLRGELIVFNYLHAFLEAMYMLREDLGSEEGRVPTVLPVEKRNLLLAKYRTALKNLQVPMPAKALRCSPDCDTRPVCSTNFKPHYNKKSLLSERVVGAPHGWSYVMKMGSTLHMNGNVDWGYLDRRPCYESSGIVNATISFQIQIQNAEQSWIKICAYDHKEGLRHAHFYLHANQQPACSHCATAAAANGNPSKEELEMILSTAIDADGAEVAKTTAAAVEGTASHAPYVLPDLHTLKRLTSRKYHGDECHAVTGLPVGKHVLTVVTHSAEDTKAGKVAPNHVYSVSHIIEWE